MSTSRKRDGSWSFRSLMPSRDAEPEAPARARRNPSGESWRPQGSASPSLALRARRLASTLALPRRRPTRQRYAAAIVRFVVVRVAHRGVDALARERAVLRVD